jgi:subfamily B ATP-binding cassette protein MsbA
MTLKGALPAGESRLIKRVIGPFRLRWLGVLALVALDTTLSTLGVGIVLPVFQALIDPGHGSPMLYKAIPILQDLTPDSRLMIVALATVGVFSLKAAVTVLTTISTHLFLQTLRFYWVARIGEYYLYGPQKTVSGKKPGELLNDWFNETLAAARFLQSTIAFYSSAMLVLALVVMCLIVDWAVMSVIAIIGALLSVVLRQAAFGGSEGLSKTKVTLNQSVSSSMIEDLTHIRDIKLLQAEATRLDGLNKSCRALARVFLKGAVLGEIPRVAGELFAVIVLMSFVAISVVALNKSLLEMLPLLAFFFITFFRLMTAASVATSARVKALNEFHSVFVVDKMLAHSCEREDGSEGEPMARMSSDLLLRDLHYAYDPTTPVLSGVTATIPNAKTTLLVGPSGAGKSTLLDLMMRLEKPQQGHIEALGRRASDYRLADWRSQFGYVSQDVALFTGDIRMNLRLADSTASDAEIERACRLAGAHDFIQALPSGYTTLVGDRGFTLSGGQRKRIAIARALIRKPAVLILDEATTSFEQSLEQTMLRALRIEMPDMTIIQVTHRLAAQEVVDWVIALDRGRVVFEGEWQYAQQRIARMLDNASV